MTRTARPGGRPHPREIAVLNGKSWPYTERFTFTEGDTVFWRVINAADGPHPMHLHGFYFNVERSGGEGADTALAPSAISVANTRLLSPAPRWPFGLCPIGRGTGYSIAICRDTSTEGTRSATS